MGKIGIIPDDLTGGTTVGVMLARSNIDTAVYFSSDNLENVEEQEALIITSDSRALPPHKAKEAVGTVLESLKANGATYFSKRIDTTLRGGIGFEIDEMLDRLSEDTIAVMVPAMPQSDRIVVGGYSVIEGTALSNTAVSKDVLTPVTESHVPTIISKQSRHKVGQVDLGSVLAGKEILKTVLEGKKAEGCKIITVDSVNMSEITLIAQTVTELNWNVLAVDPGVFTQELALARGIGIRKEEIKLTHDEYSLKLNPEDKILIVAGSATNNTKRQLNKLNEYDQSEMVSADPVKLANPDQADEEVNKAFSKLNAVLNDPEKNIAIIETVINKEVIDLGEIEKKYSLKSGEASRNINIGLANIAQKSLKDGNDIRGIYLTGGDTMVTTLKSLGAIGINLIDYVIPQTDIGRIIGGPHDGLITIGKGGLTGSLHTAVQSVNRISKEYKNRME